MAENEDVMDMTTSDEPDKAVKPAPAVPPTPPLEAAALRLERLLGKAADKLDFYTNPVKVVRRWLGTSSGASSKATVDDIKGAAANLLDPSGPCAAGRQLLVSAGQKAEPSDSYLTIASAREVEAWLLSLAVRLLWRERKYLEALELSQNAIQIVLRHLEAKSIRGVTATASSLFPLLARLYRLRGLVAEQDPVVAVSLRSDMTQAHNMATLRRDVDTQATLLNSMLRDLLRTSQSKCCDLVCFCWGSFISIILRCEFFTTFPVEQAEKLLSNSTFPETASNNQLCRFLYYSGRIQALRLEYTTSYSNLSQCLRKAPTNTGLGFRIAAQRLLVVVQLLMGEIPERHVFSTVGMKKELSPYLAITQAVRRGDLAVFNKVVSEQASRLKADGTYTLISRLAHQVVKAGLRKLHVSYSRLSLQDVADRLGLPSAKSAEYVVAKAVRDGVLDATIHHQEGYVQSHDLVDVYATKEPVEAFHRRIAYCLTTHNDAVRGMRYPPDAYKKQLEASRGNRRKQSDDKTDEEKAKELEDELEDDF